MNNDELFELLNFILNESETGNAITPEDRGMLLKAASWEFFRALVKNYEDNQEVTDSIEPFKVHAANIPFVLGVGTRPADYYRHGGSLYLDTIDGVIYKRKVDIVTDLEWNDRLSSYLTRPTLKNPILKFADGLMYIQPITITLILMDYINTPDEPEYDYYFDADGNLVYMPEGTSRNLAIGEVYRTGETVGNFNSISVELPYTENDKLLVGSIILEKMGVNLKAGEIVEFSSMFKAQNA